MERGQLRAAHKEGGEWKVNLEVKGAILEIFRRGKMAEQAHPWEGFVDKEGLEARFLSLEEKIRLVPGGSSIRRGSYLAPGVVVMPPSYVNVGAYIDEGTMVDSHVLVGSCAQIGKGVHLSAGVQIGGVLEPVGQAPVIIEDGVFLGAQAAVLEGILVGKGAVIGAGTILSRSIPVYDCVKESLLPRGAPIPPGALVAPGTRPVVGKSPWAREQGLGLACALIVKYRDDRTEAGLMLEEALRRS